MVGGSHETGAAVAVHFSLRLRSLISAPSFLPLLYLGRPLPGLLGIGVI